MAKHKTEPKSLRFQKDLFRRIENYAAEAGCTSFNAAVEKLCELGLLAAKQENVKSSVLGFAMQLEDLVKKSKT